MFVCLENADSHHLAMSSQGGLYPFHDRVRTMNLCWHPGVSPSDIQSEGTEDFGTNHQTTSNRAKSVFEASSLVSPLALGQSTNRDQSYHNHQMKGIKMIAENLLIRTPTSRTYPVRHHLWHMDYAPLPARYVLSQVHDSSSFDKDLA